MPIPVRSEILTGYINGYVDSEVHFLVFNQDSLFQSHIGWSHVHARSSIRFKKKNNIVSQKLSQELEAGSIIGPLDNRPDDLVLVPHLPFDSKEKNQVNFD